MVLLYSSLCFFARRNLQAVHGFISFFFIASNDKNYQVCLRTRMAFHYGYLSWLSFMVIFSFSRSINKMLIFASAFCLVGAIIRTLYQCGVICSIGRRKGNADTTTDCDSNNLR